MPGGPPLQLRTSVTRTGNWSSSGHVLPAISSSSSPRLTPNSCLQLLSASTLPKCTPSTACSLELLLNARCRPRPHSQEPTNTKSSADSWISQRCIIAPSLSSPGAGWYPAHVRKEKTSNWFCWGNNLRDKCPVYNHLPSLGVCVFLSEVPLPLIAHSPRPRCHPGDGGAVRSPERTASGGEKCGFPGSSRNQSAPPSHKPPF